eukprot:351118_1
MKTIVFKPVVEPSVNYKVVITFGTFDLTHIGHVRILKRAKELGDKLVVGISSDEFNKKKKDVYPIFSQNERKEIIENFRFVDEVFFEESMEKKREYIQKYKANLLVMGADWKGEFDSLNDICDVVYLDRTDGISTTHIIEKIVDNSITHIKNTSEI